MIRKINSGDRSLFLRMTEDFYNSEAVLCSVPSEHHEATFNELMRSDEYLECYIFECAGELAGYALLTKSFSQEAGGPVVWLDELYVTPQHRGKGLAREFLSFMEQEIPAARYRLEVEPDNKRAASLYRRQGFSTLPYIQMVKQK